MNLLSYFNLFLFSSATMTNIGNIKVQEDNYEMNYHQFYVLGDSLSDTGAFVGALTEVVKDSWFLPHLSEIYLESPFYKNRSFSNDRLAAERLAQDLNFNLTPAWKFSTNFFWQKRDYNYEGNNYAVAGSTLDENDSWSSLYSNYFTVRKQFDSLLSQHSLESNDLVLLESGNNDLLTAISEENSAEQDKIIENSVLSITDTIKNLVTNGVEHIIVTSVPDLSKTPKYLNTDQAALAHHLSSVYNDKWAKAIEMSQKLFPNVIKGYRFDQAFDRFVSDFAKLGGNVTQSAIETSKFSLITEGKIGTEYINGATPETIDNFFFLDEIHPTSTIHQWVADDWFKLVKEWKN